MSKKQNILFIFPLALSVLLILLGGVMIVKDLAAYGVNSRTLKLSGLGGHLLIFIGIIFLVVTYYSLSPYSWVRNIDFNFFNRKRKRTGIRKND